MIKNSWEPIIIEKQTEQIQFHINKIASICLKKIHFINDIGLFTGLSGLVMFLSYYNQYKKSSNLEGEIFEAISRILNLIDTKEQPPTYCSGVAGVGIMFLHLHKKGFIELDTDNFFENIDEYLYQSLLRFIKDDNFDFLHGYLGILYYFLERLQFNQLKSTQNIINDAIIKTYDHIATKAKICMNGIKWESRVSRNSNVRGYNLGLAHGIPSIINMLLKLTNFVDKLEKRRLISQGINYIESNKFDNEKTSLFSNFIRSDGVNSGISRLGWCYGDLGIGLTFLNVGELLKSQDIENKAIDILNHASERRKWEINGVRDACFCHGTSGISHIFNSAYQRTGALKFKNTAIYWNQQTIKFLEQTNGYKTWFGRLGWQNEYGILEGISGVGLTLLAFISEIEPDWDNHFLIR